MLGGLDLLVGRLWHHACDSLRDFILLSDNVQKLPLTLPHSGSNQIKIIFNWLGLCRIDGYQGVSKNYWDSSASRFFLEGGGEGVKKVELTGGRDWNEFSSYFGYLGPITP